MNTLSVPSSRCSFVKQVFLREKNPRKIGLLLGCLFFCALPSLFSQPTVSQLWLQRFDGLNFTDSYGKKIGTDSLGNNYSLGSVETGLLHGGSTVSTIALGYNLVKMNALGGNLWVHDLLVNRAPTQDQPSMMVSSTGSLTFFGNFLDSVDLDPSPASQWVYPQGGKDLLVYRLSPTGNVLWLRHLTGVGEENAISHQVDPQGNTYLLGRIKDSLDADPGPGTSWLTATVTQPAVCVIKLDPNGNFVWARQLRGPAGQIWGTQLDIGPNQEVYVVGTFVNSIDFDPGSGTTLLDGGIGPDTYFLKLDQTGQFLWAKKIGENRVFFPVDMGVDQDGALTTVGHMMDDSLDVDPGPDSSLVIYPDTLWGFTFPERPSVLIHQLNAQGEFQWVRQFAGGSEDDGGLGASGLHIGACGDIYVIGSCMFGIFAVDRQMEPMFPEEESQEPSPENHNDDAFMLRLQPNGDLVWLEKIGQSGDGNNEIGIDISVNQAGEIYNLQQDGYHLWEVRRYQQPTVTTDTVLYVTACESYLSPSGNFLWDSSGVYLDTIQTCYPLKKTGLEIHLTIGHPEDTTLKLGACAPFELNGYTYTNSGQYTQVIPTTAGCDSTILLQLALVPSSYNSITDSACQGYQLNGYTYQTSGTYVQYLTNSIGCDSVLTVDLTIWPTTDSSFSHITCGSYLINGDTISSSGSYTQHFTNAEGCDSILSFHVVVMDSLDISFNQDGNDLVANGAGLDYQWLVCDGVGNFAPFPGANQQVFQTSGAGSYALLVSNGVCTDTSECITLGVSGIDNFPAQWQLWPNPSDGWVHLQLDRSYASISTKLYNLQGQQLSEVHAVGQELSFQLPEVAGVYLMEVVADGRVGWSKLVRE